MQNASQALLPYKDFRCLIDKIKTSDLLLNLKSTANYFFPFIEVFATPPPKICRFFIIAFKAL